MRLLNGDFTPVRIVYSLVLFVVGLATCGGCGGGNGGSSGDKATVSGKITNDGKPVTPDSVVTFFCPDTDVTASGKLDVLGSYSLTPGDPKKGIAPGRYKVMINGPTAPPVQVGTNSDEYKKMMMGQGPKVEPAKDIPEKFTTFLTSGLNLEVKAGANTFDLDLAKLPQ